MVFAKVIKNKAYYKRYQVKYRRRREGKTDYYQRKKLIIQAKNKYATPKYRLVVRFTGKRVICQIFHSTIKGDFCLAQAESNELGRYGLKVGLKNYPAAYCTGLLVGRRVLQKLGLDEKYTGVGNDEEDEVTGEVMSVEFNKRKYFVDELDDDRSPFRVYLDIGLARTSIGAKIFGALKGAADSGLDIPHNAKKFPGYDPDEKEYDVDMHRERIFGDNIKDYMEMLIEDDQESGTDRFGELFPGYKEHGIGPDDLEDLYLSVHKAIRADPSPKHKESAKVRRAATKHDTKYKFPTRRTKAQKDAAVQAKLALLVEEEASSDEDSE